MYSIKRRLLLVLVIGFAAVISVSGAYLARVLGDRVTQEFDAGLRSELGALAALTEQENGVIEFDYVPAYMPQFERDADPHLFQFWLDDGTPLLRSTHLAVDLTRPDPPPADPVVYDLTLPDGRPGRLAGLAFVPHGPESEPGPDDAWASLLLRDGERRGVVLVVVRSRDDLDLLIGQMHGLIFGLGALATVIASLLVWFALGAGFRPIHSIAAQVEGLHAERLSERVALPRVPRELQPVVDELNALLDRLDASFARERRFSSNVAHELRTPIAELRSLAQVGSAWPDDPVSVAAFFGDVNDIAGRMEIVIADLLLLARCHAGIENAETEPVLLEEVVTTAWAPLVSRADERGIRLEYGVAQGLVVATDAGKLGIVFANLFGNAVTYARRGSVVCCIAQSAKGAFTVEVSNAAEPLSDAELGQLTEPFWRKDPARESAEHAGLGLSLVSALAELLRLRISLGQRTNGTFWVRLEGAALESSPALDRVVVGSPA